MTVAATRKQGITCRVYDHVRWSGRLDVRWLDRAHATTEQWEPQYGSEGPVTSGGSDRVGRQCSHGQDVQHIVRADLCRRNARPWPRR